MRKTYDFLVIGSGLAGLTNALKVADYGKVALVSKTKLEESNTYYAQGGIAAVTYQPDSYKKHVNDTLVAGDGLCNRKIVEMIISEAPDRINELIKWGAEFDKKADGNYDLAKEGGHSEKRILHHKDNTGFEIQRALIEQVKKNKSIEILDYYFAIDLITQHQLGYHVIKDKTDIECYGIYALDRRTKNIITILSKTVFLATGGIGNIYSTTTNPSIATGDGISMVYRAKEMIENMEFVQFHPTSLYNPGERPSFLITEAIRGFGALLLTQDEKEFMHKYDKRGCLAPRDIVARAIDNELKLRGEDYVYLKCSHLANEELKKHFPNINNKCLTLGIDITKDYIPVVPAAHYSCGGVKVNAHGQTSIKFLYAAGEVTSTGLHGANRLASNSLLEAVVYSHRAAEHAKSIINDINIIKGVPDWNDEGTSLPEELILITQELKELQQIMTNYVGIVRSNLRLKRALDRLNIIYKETETLYEQSTVSQKLCKLRNSINVSYNIIKMAKNRRESRGLHYNIDYPEKYVFFE
ncbi:MAG: L-aspartate oxidase [Bacteroidales bacterium]|nr:L-aspartate oxidase [Bacteroidales bacterium]